MNILSLFQGSMYLGIQGYMEASGLYEEIMY